MSSETLIENLKDIRTDAFDTIKNIEAVRGKGYALMVHSLLLSHQIADITNIMMSVALTNPEPHKIEAVRDAMSMCICQILTNVADASNLPEEMVREAMTHSDAIAESTANLIKQAVDAERTGSAFGGRNAA